MLVYAGRREHADQSADRQSSMKQAALCCQQAIRVLSLNEHNGIGTLDKRFFFTWRDCISLSDTGRQQALEAMGCLPACPFLLVLSRRSGNSFCNRLHSTAPHCLRRFLFRFILFMARTVRGGPTVGSLWQWAKVLPLRFPTLHWLNGTPGAPIAGASAHKGYQSR